MSFLQTILYDDADGFTYDAAKVEFVGGKAQLKKVPNPGQVFAQSFAASTGFTFDAAKAEFVGGLLRQVDLAPAAAVLGATFTSSTDASWTRGGIVGTATLTGAPTLVAGKLSCTGGTAKGLYYQDAGIGSARAVKWKWTPNYTGGAMAGGANTNVLALSPPTGNNDNVVLTHNNSTSLRIGLYNSVGGVILAVGTIFTGSLFSPVAGTEYEFELNLDPAAGTIKLYINGVQTNSMSVGAWTRGTAATRLHLGAGPSYNVADSSYNDVKLFSSVQHSSGYTPGYTVSETLYGSSTVVLPAFTYTGIGTIIAVESAAVIETGTPRFTIGGAWWNGSAWVASNGTYAEANPFATAVANLTALDVVGATSVTVRAYFTDSNTLGSLDNLTVTVTGQIYPTTNPTIDASADVGADALYTFDAVVTDTVTFILFINEQAKYWDGTEWADSDGSFAQSSTAGDINANAAALDIATGADLRVRAFLHSGSGSSTPDLTSATLSYDFYPPNPTAPNECVVYATVRDILGEDVAGAKLIVTPTALYFHGTQLILPVAKSVTSDADGRFEISLVETDTVSKQYRFQIEYGPRANRVTVDLGLAEVPNTSSVNLSTLTFT